ncbi:NUDIX domain-containing protein [Nonomuraea spiralis]|uniref:NUDIX domain-containing protein n=1 Tax=Nonomuraea TaxID=83681 RepID=UPI000F7B06CC|nr:NUDIX domain-containing protein [Nonomuraea sp. WAC 01424]RSN02001.1 hypothetical protein DMB42_38290 [Nonomuraea sp. WAC 01424]
MPPIVDSRRYQGGCEAREELGILIDPADLDFAGVCHHADPDGQARIGIFFATSRWSGEPVNAEPSKCDKIDWFALDDLPDDIVTYIRTGIDTFHRGDAFSLDGWQREAPPHPPKSGAGLVV